MENSKKHLKVRNDIDFAEKAKLDVWWSKYGKVEDEILARRERRRESVLRNRRKRALQFGDILELSEGQAGRWRRDGFFSDEELWRDVFADPGYLAYVAYIKRETSLRVAKVKASIRRPHYYERENERRRSLAALRRKVSRRYTENACPTKEQILDAWVARRNSHEDAMYFGSLLEDLECYLDNSLLRDENGAILGRRPGIKGWLKENIPALALQYTSVMRYKVAARKMRELTGLRDPTPLEVIIPSRKKVFVRAEKMQAEAEEAGAKESGSDGGKTKCADANAKVAVPNLEIVRARAIWEEVVSGVPSSATALMARIDALTNPHTIEDRNMLAGWKEKYDNEITVRTKLRWWRKWRW